MGGDGLGQIPALGPSRARCEAIPAPCCAERAPSAYLLIRPLNLSPHTLAAKIEYAVVFLPRVVDWRLISAQRPRRLLQTGFGTPPNQIALEFGEAGHDRAHERAAGR